MDFQLPFAWLNLKPHDSFVLKEGDSGVGDVVIGPIPQWDPIMGKEGPIFVHRFEFQVIFPTGQYNKHKEINAGSNFFSLDPYWAGTVFLTRSGRPRGGCTIFGTPRTKIQPSALFPAQATRKPVRHFT